MFRPLKMRTLCSLEMLGTSHPVMQCYTLEKQRSEVKKIVEFGLGHFLWEISVRLTQCHVT